MYLAGMSRPPPTTPRAGGIVASFATYLPADYVEDMRVAGFNLVRRGRCVGQTRVEVDTMRLVCR